MGEQETPSPADKALSPRTPGAVYAGTNDMPRTGGPGRVLHVGLADGELAERVVVVGHPNRAEILASLLQPEEAGKDVFRLASDRGFMTFTGLYEGVRVSVVSVGMGLTMMDFFIREARAVVEGPMAIVRFGTCGGMQAAIPVGAIGVATEGSILLQRNYAAFGGSAGDVHDGLEHYTWSEPCLPDGELSAAIEGALRQDLGDDKVAPGLNITADSFYGSQGRRDPNFPDANETLIDEVLERHPKAVTMEMETFQLLHLARCCRPSSSIRATAASVIVANRPTGNVLDGATLVDAERRGGNAILRALASFTLS